MIIPHLPGHSRVWFFGANRILTADEIAEFNVQLTKFVSDWKAHGAAISAGYEIMHESIIIIAADETQAAPSGCSIDKAFGLLKASGIDFFQRQLIWRAFCNTSEIFTLNEAAEQLKSNNFTPQTLIINSMVTNLEQVRNQFYIPLGESWASKKLNYER
jgi:hypothetical protein